MNVLPLVLSLAIMVPGGTTSDLEAEKLSIMNRPKPIENSIVQRKRVPTASRGNITTNRSYSGDGAEIIRTVAAQHGCGDEETSMLLHIAHKESTLRTTAVSKTGKYVGLFQLGPHLGSYEERIDPYWNTARAIRYMRGRYGSIAAAYSFRNANNWY